MPSNAKQMPATIALANPTAASPSHRPSRKKRNGLPFSEPFGDDHFVTLFDRQACMEGNRTEASQKGPLLAQSGHWVDRGRMTAFDPKRTFEAAKKIAIF